MNPETPREARELFSRIKRMAVKLRRVATVICPPAVFLPLLTGGKNLDLGGQDISAEVAGAHTGSISATQMKHSGATYILIGHSERRYPETGEGESEETINKKLRIVLKLGLRPVLCVGETKRDEQGEYLHGLRAMIEEGVAKVRREDFKKLILAYEPVWAIGNSASVADTPESFLEHSIFLRKIIAGRFGSKLAMACPILYGGSVSVSNAVDFLTRGEASGLLIGRESLRADHFNKILHLADKL